MNNTFIAIAELYGFNMSKGQAWGLIRGLPVVMNDEEFIVWIITDGMEDKLGDFFSETVEKNLCKKYFVSDKKIGFSFDGLNIGRTKELIELMMDFLSTLGVQPSCSICGQTSKTSFARMGGDVLNICDTCFEKKEKEISIPVTVRNSTLGVVGAIIGALLGGLIWVLIGYFGFISSLGGLAIVFFAYKGYVFMKGRVTLFTPFLIGILTIIVVFISNFVTLLIGLNQIKEGSEYSGMPIINQVSKLLNLILNNEQARGLFLVTTGIGMIFAIVGGFIIFKRIFSSIQRREVYSIEKV